MYPGCYSLEKWKNRRVLTLADTGTGISHDVLKRMFDQFFSTKGTGRRFGSLDLRQLIARNSGDLRVWSSRRPRHAGTVFTLFLPDTAEHPRLKDDSFQIHL